MTAGGKPRRPKGTGSIYKRDGVVIGQYVVQTPKVDGTMKATTRQGGTIMSGFARTLEVIHKVHFGSKKGRPRDDRFHEH